MKTFIAWLLMSSVAFAGWVEADKINVRYDNSKTPTAVFVNSYSNTGPLAGQWYQIDVTTMGIPADAKSVFLSGLLIVTHGTTAQTCDMTVALRAPGDTMVSGNYIGQVVEAHVGGGQRSGFASWVPVKNGKFEFYWSRNTYSNWPAECSYGINLSAQAWVR